MKFIISILFIFLQFLLYSQNMIVKYDVESSFKTSLPIPGAPRSVKVLIEIINDGEHFLISTSLKRDSTQKIFSANKEDNITLVSTPNNKMYAFDTSKNITEVFFLRRDTLIGVGETTKIRNIPCQAYTLKGNRNVKVYASKKLDKKINPGLNYYSPKPLGGIVKIEIPRATIIYQLVSFEETMKKIDLYILKMMICKITPTFTQSILLKQ